MDRTVKIILKPGKEAAVKRFHPWIFSGAIDRTEGVPHEGDVVDVFSSRRELVAKGHFLPGSISVKIFSFTQEPVNEDFWMEKLKTAYKLRVLQGLTTGTMANAYRLVFTEGDGLPGLIIDYYNGVAVIQTHSLGMQRLVSVFARGLREIYGEKLVAVYDKSSETLGRSQGLKTVVTPGGKEEMTSDQFLFGSSGPVEIQETGHRFMVDFILGQKTGFFLDQRGNRMFAQFYGRGRKVLNAFCYSGAFSVYALKGGALSVHSVDSSQQAIAWTKENMKLNDIPDDVHTEEVADVKRLLTHTTENYDMIILDPPAFAKHHNISHNALQAYIYINGQAMKRLNPGGILFTFSCSQVINREMFRSAIQAAAIETGKNVKILHQLSQGADHPISIFHPEGEYLKGLIVAVE